MGLRAYFIFFLFAKTRIIFCFTELRHLWRASILLDVSVRFGRMSEVRVLYQVS